MTRSWPAMAIALSLLTLPLSARAQTEDELAQARALGQEGLALFDKGEYQAALAKIDEAETYARVPTLDLFGARALARLDRLLEAKARFQEVEAMPLPPNSPEVWYQAKVDAAEERAKLEAQIPSIAIHVVGVGAAVRTELLLDGKPLRAGTAPVPVDPGPHEISARAGAESRRASVMAERGKTHQVRLDFAPAKRAEPDAGPSPLVIVGAVTLALGGAGLIVWGGTGGAALTKAHDHGCDADGQCQSQNVSDLQTLRTASLVSFYTGTGLALVGASLLVAGVVVQDSEPTQATLYPVVGARFVGLGGRF